MNRSIRFLGFGLAIALLTAGGLVCATEPMPKLPNLSQPEPGKYASGAVSPNDVDTLAKAGIRHVINLRPDGEMPDFDEAAAMRAAGIEYFSLPIGSAADLNLDNVRKLDAAMNAQAGAPSLLHCASSNRVGALMALRAGWLQNKPAEEAVAEGKRWGLASLEGVVRQRLATSPR